MDGRGKELIETPYQNKMATYYYIVVTKKIMKAQAYSRHPTREGNIPCLIRMTGHYLSHPPSVEVENKMGKGRA